MRYRAYVPISESPTITIAPGPPALCKAVLPSLRRPGERFHLGIKAEDAFGNPSDQIDARLRLKASMPVDGLPESCQFCRGERALVIEELAVADEGDLEIEIFEAEGKLLTKPTLW